MTRPRRLLTLLAAAGALVVVVLAGVYWQDIAAWVRFYRLFESVGLNEQGYPEFRHRQTGIIMVRVPGGTFMMGSPERPDGISTAEQPRHQVTLSPFLVAKYEVTREQWLRVSDSDPSIHKGDDLPVNAVSWNVCKEFCEKTGLKLPTEAQWEYSCRAGDTSRAYRSRPGFGDRVPGVVGAGGERLDGMTDEKFQEVIQSLGAVAWFRENSGDKLHPVGGKSPNAFGLHDMLGNAFELCEDVYDREFYSKPESRGRDPVCTSGSEQRVSRGGCFWTNSDLQNIRSTYRFPFAPDFTSRPVGFLGFRAAYYPLPPGL